MPSLVIVESPHKAKTIGKILGPDYTVMPSYGHIRDLPTDDIAVAPPTFKPRYVSDKFQRGQIAKLKKEAATADRVILATDPDREGEAIAWHLAEVLTLRSPQRVTFKSITPACVRRSIMEPRQIDMDLVAAQEARRVLDRLVGYQVSPALTQAQGTQLTAGRVQSPAVRIVVDRERAIVAFQPTEHYSAELTFAGAHGATWTARLEVASVLGRKDGERLTDAAVADGAAAVRVVTVDDVQLEQQEVAPPAPFITSSLQGEASRRLKLKPKAAMSAAQHLFDAGLITYHRTDNPNWDAETFEQFRQYAASDSCPFELPVVDTARTWKARATAQEGHTAILPTDFAATEAGTDPDQRALYQLIWQRAVASQLAPALYAKRVVRLQAGATDDLPGGSEPPTYKAVGRSLVSLGWKMVHSLRATTALAADIDDGEADDGDENPVPELEFGARLSAASGRRLTLSTKPPRRFTLATLGAELERLGIGRPSTYASILETIVDRGYVVEGTNDFLEPTPTGYQLRDALAGHFQFAELEYTSELEQLLDQVAAGKAPYLSAITGAHTQLADELGRLASTSPERPPEHPCPECGKAMRRRAGKRRGTYWWGCTGYPECSHTQPDVGGVPGERQAPPVSEHKCRACEKPLIRRTGRGKRGAFDFWGCSGFPACKQTYRPGPGGAPVYPEA